MRQGAREQGGEGAALLPEGLARAPFVCLNGHVRALGDSPGRAPGTGNVLCPECGAAMNAVREPARPQRDDL